MIGKITRHTDTVRTLHFSPCGAFLASGSGDEKVCVWDVSKVAWWLPAEPIAMPAAAAVAAAASAAGASSGPPGALPPPLAVATRGDASDAEGGGGGEGEGEDTSDPEASPRLWERSSSGPCSRAPRAGVERSMTLNVPDTSVSLEEVLRERDESVARLSAALSMDETLAEALLNAGKWRTREIEERWLAGSAEERDAMRAAAGLGAAAARGVESVECSICLCPLADEDDASAPPSPSHPSLVRFECGHSLHGPCLRQMALAYLTARNPLPWRSPCSRMCKSLVPLAAVESVLESGDDGARARLAELRANPFQLVGPYVSCPNPACTQMVRPSLENKGDNITVLCSCGVAFCYGCRAPPHEPLPCLLAREFAAFAEAAARMARTPVDVAAIQARFNRLYGAPVPSLGQVEEKAVQEGAEEPAEAPRAAPLGADGGGGGPGVAAGVVADEAEVPPADSDEEEEVGNEFGALRGALVLPFPPAGCDPSGALPPLLRAGSWGEPDLRLGDVVVRGKDWKWGDVDGG